MPRFETQARELREFALQRPTTRAMSTRLPTLGLAGNLTVAVSVNK